MNWLVIMAGGYGERFWPLSRRKQAKQFLPIVGKRTMIQQTVARVRPLFAPSRMMVATNRDQVRLVRRQLPAIKHIIAEPVGRNTAPCVCLAAVQIARQDPDAVMAVLPSDHVIADTARYRAVLQSALELARKQDVLITLGIKPTEPHTGYGYIEIGEAVSRRFWKVKRFVEKPDLATAEKFVASGRYQWNAGMFVWHVQTILTAYRRFAPGILAACEKITDAKSLAREYPRIEKISIDYAIMEKTDNVVAAQGDFDWDDVGDWPGVGRHYRADAAGNVARGNFIGVDASDCIAVGDAGHLIGVVGLKDVVVVHTKDATLVCRKQDSQKVRKVVKQLAAEKRYRKLL